MSLTAKSCDLEAITAGPRAALRERLLNIVGLVPDDDGEPNNRAPLFREHSEKRISLLLFNDEIGHIFAAELIAWIRSRNPEAGVDLVNFQTGFRELPCEFGEGHLAKLSGEAKRVAEAAAAHWRCMDRSFVVARTVNRICAKRLGTPAEKA